MSAPSVTSRVVSTAPDGTVVIETTIKPATTPTPPPIPPTPAPSGLPWLGASEGGAHDGTLAAQLASGTVAVGGTWCDATPEDQLAMYSIGPGGKWAAWNRPLDVAVGAIFKGRGETWAAAAAGAYEARWRQALTTMRTRWGTRDKSLLWISFAREFNGGDWQKLWGASPSEVAAYKVAHERWNALQSEIMPGSRRVWSLNDGTGWAYDVRRHRPSGMDAWGVDTYNSWPHVTNASEWQAKILARDGQGGPRGIEAHRRDAEQAGLPIVIPEWGQNGDPKAPGGGGDSPYYIDAMRDWMGEHAGSGPGQVLYAVYFNTWAIHQLWPQTMSPKSWARYRAIF